MNLKQLDKIRSQLREFEVTVRVRAPNKKLARSLVRNALLTERERWQLGRPNRVRGKNDSTRLNDLQIELSLIDAEYSVTHRAVKSVPE